MMLKLGVIAAVATVATTSSQRRQPAAPAAADSIVLRVFSRDSLHFRVQGAIIGTGVARSQELRETSTPFELRVASNDVRSVFHALDNREIAGEIVVFRDGKQLGRANGNGNVIMMYLEVCGGLA